MRSEKRTREAARRLEWRFAAASLAAFVPIGLVLSLMISHQLVDQAEREAKSRAEFVTNSILRNEISQTYLSFLVAMKGPSYESFRRFVDRRVVRYPVSLVRIWRSDGMVVFSSVPGQIGRTYPLLPGVRRSFHQYTTVNAIEGPDAPEDASIHALPARVVKTYVPVFLGEDGSGGIPVAVAEVYTDYSVVQSQVTKVFRILAETLSAGLLALYILMFPIVRRVSKRLRAQHARLESLLEKEQRLQAERRRLLDRTLRAAEDERIRIAAELHDGPVQRVARLGYGLERIRLKLSRGDVEGAEEVLESVQAETFEEVKELRGMMSQLRPPVLDQRGLEEALRDRAAEVERDSGVTCVVNAMLDRRLDSSLETVLYRVSQEALTNVAKHAEASRVDLTLHRENGSVALEIKDDGKGFENVPTGENGSHFGLLAMRERVEMTGGRWEVESRPGEGTRIKAVLPLEVDA